MTNKTTYEVVANTFTVIEISNPVNVFAEPSESTETVCTRFMEIESETFEELCIVRNEHSVCGYVLIYDLWDMNDNNKVHGITIPITPDQMVPASMPIMDLLPLFEQHHFFFVLVRNAITHIVYFRDLDKLPMKLCLFSLFMELEAKLLLDLQRLIYRQDDLLTSLSEESITNAKEICARKYKKVTPERILLCTTFKDRTELWLRNPAISRGMDFTARRWFRDFFKVVGKMRNQIAHSGSIFEVRDDPKSLNEFVTNLRAVISGMNPNESRCR